MKYLRTIPILFLTFLFSAEIPVFAYKNVSLVGNSSNSISTNLNGELNSTIINMPKENVVDVFNHNDNIIYLTEDDINLMAKIVYAESKGEPFDGKIAVASVILNRTTDSQFPDTIHGVITQKNAFSCVRNGKIDVVPDGDSYNAVLKAIEGYDPTDEALYFYNPKIATCSWMKGVEKTGEKSIGQHVFFNVT